jgi:hypothetical protein
MREELLETEAIELPAGQRDAGEPTARPLPAPAEPPGAVSPWRGDVRAAVLAAAGGLVAGAATVVVARATRTIGGRRPARRSRRQRPVNVVASRSFIVDVHLLSDK